MPKPKIVSKPKLVSNLERTHNIRNKNILDIETLFSSTP